MFEKILIANRGEIACRIIDTCQRLGIKTAAIYANNDRESRFVRMADEAYPLFGFDGQSTYLNIEKIIKIAKQCGAQAIHPGYGFVSENPQFARECQANNIVFIGAQAEAIEAMGLKDSAKKIAQNANVPILEGYMSDDQSLETLMQAAQKIGFPLLIKAIAGGGGRGIRIVNNIDEFATNLEGAKREAKSAFNDDRVMLEKFITKPRHIEVQVFGDNFGNIIHIYERECSVQRRRQKLIEEAPAPNLPNIVRQAMFDAAIKLAKAVNYQGAGTVEFILDGAKPPSLDSFWFLEMNTRLQVEHKVSEAISGIDFVELQFKIAAGEKLNLKQEEIPCMGHAIEARIIAEDPYNGFMPSSGQYIDKSEAFHGVMIERGYENNDFVPANFDSLMEKIICHRENRQIAIWDLQEALGDKLILSPPNNIGFIKNIMALEEFNSGQLHTNIIDENNDILVKSPYDIEKLAAIAAIFGYLAQSPKNQSSFINFPNLKNQNEKLVFTIGKNEFICDISLDNDNIKAKTDAIEFSLNMPLIDINGQNFYSISNDLNAEIHGFTDNLGVSLIIEGRQYRFDYKRHDIGEAHVFDKNEIHANLPGKVVAINHKLGDLVKVGDCIIVVEAMKMEHTLCASLNGKITNLNCEIGQQVKLGEILARVE